MYERDSDSEYAAENEQYDESRIMFVARLERMAQQGDRWLTVEAVLALLSDCDYLASRPDLLWEDE